MPSTIAIAQAVRELTLVDLTQRIRKLTITPQPNGVVLDFSTDMPTMPVVEIFRLVRDANGALVFDASEVVAVLFEGGAEAVAIVAYDEAHAHLITVRDGVVRAARRGLSLPDQEPPHWVTLGEDMQSGLTTLLLEDGSTAIIGLCRAGGVYATRLIRDQAYRGHWSALGGGFVGRVAALAVNDGLELFGVTAEGGVQHKIWQLGVEEKSHWRSLGGESITHVSATEDDSGKHLIALTRDRSLLSLTRQSAGFNDDWQRLGSLDELGRDERTRGEVSSTQQGPPTFPPKGLERRSDAA